MSEWQDIASAPKQHLARFLAYATPRSEYEQAIYEVTRYDDQWGNHIRLNDGYGNIGERDILKRIMHWMPFRTAPKPHTYQHLDNDDTTPDTSLLA